MILGAIVMIVGLLTSVVSNSEGAARRFGGERGGQFAEIFHTDKETFIQDVKNGKSLEEIALLHGVDPSAAKVELTDRLSQMLRLADTMGSRRGGFLGNRRGNSGTMEKLSDEEMKVLQTNLPVYIGNAFVKPGLLNISAKMQTILGAGAKVLGMSQAELIGQLQRGATVKVLAESRGISLSEVSDGMSREAGRHTDELVADGILPDFLAQRIKANLDNRINKMLESGYSKDWAESTPEAWTTLWN